ncbi:MAG: tetratricopeptide repeat protein [Pirellulaceae bacterium]|nr:tetratricopeptide repeat protein [Pirellulaceae bacterium]
MSQVEESFAVREIVLSNSSFGPREIEQITAAIASDFSNYSVLRDAVSDLEMREDRTPAVAVRLGVCYYLLGRYRVAVDTLVAADGGALAHFYLGRAYFAQEEFANAVSSFESAQQAGYDGDQCSLRIADTQRSQGDPERALATLDSLSGAIEHSAEYLYQRGATVSSLKRNPSEVVALFERAVAADGTHAGALFGLAKENERRGNDEEALDLYQRSVSRFPAHVGSLLNLGLLYEDREDYERARQCYQRVLDAFPNHSRAKLFIKDAQASGDMYFDEDAEKQRDRLAQVLNIPVTDFELSVRSRNCLQKMGIRTLGDLARCTEQELLTSKNFGETSLVEIRDMLTSKGLELGQFAHEKAEPEPVYDMSDMSPDEQALLERPIADLNLSVRARKCMVRLGLNTIGELVRRSGDDLLECKNFGVTSLNEVREKLTNFSLRLRGD